MTNDAVFAKTDREREFFYSFVWRWRIFIANPHDALLFIRCNYNFYHFWPHFGVDCVSIHYLLLECADFDVHKMNKPKIIKFPNLFADFSYDVELFAQRNYNILITYTVLMRYENSTIVSSRKNACVELLRRIEVERQ